MKKSALFTALFLTLLVSSNCIAEINVKDLPGLKEGIAYSIKDKELKSITTVTALSWKGINLEAGYATEDAAVGVLSYDLFKASDYIEIPILEWVEFRPGVYAGIANIGGDNSFDWGFSATLVEVKF